MNRRRFLTGLSLLPMGLLMTGAEAAVPASTEQVEALHQELDRLCLEYQQLNFPMFAMGIEENLRQIPEMPQLHRQSQWIAHNLPKLQLTPSELPGQLCARREAFLNDLEFLQEWNALSLLYRKNPKEVQPSRGHSAMNAEERAAIQKLYDKGASCVYLTHERWKGLVCLEQAPRWYDLYTRFWTSLPTAQTCHPVELAERALAQGHSEIQRLQQELEVSDLKNYLQSPERIISDESVLLAEFEALDRKVRALKLLSWEVPPVRFARMGKDNPTQAPGLYRGGTFYYDFSEGFPRQNLVWLYLNEVLPGHHAQMSRSPQGTRPRLLQYPGMMEGWGVYAEHLGAEHGLMDDPLQRLGWVLWDQVRSARVFLDWQIHRQGWTRGQAISWWEKNLPSPVSERAHPEVGRVMQWPAQSLSYKVGEYQLLQLRNQHRLRLGSNFREREFNGLVLQTPYSSWQELFHHL